MDIKTKGNMVERSLTAQERGGWVRHPWTEWWSWSISHAMSSVAC